MKLVFLGVSAAFAVGDNLFHSNMLIESTSGKKILIDCGSDVRHSLHALGYSYGDIDAVYVSHLHADHAGGLEWLGFCKKFRDHQKAALYISEDQRATLWTNLLSGSMSSLEKEHATLESYFDVAAIDEGCFFWEQHEFRLIKTHHAVNCGCLLPSYGLLITGDSKKIFITTDTRFHLEYLASAYQEADLIFNDCEIMDNPTGQHATYNELTQLDRQTKAKMWLYDYDCDLLPDAEKDGFKGFVVRGQTFEF
ncbi:MAG: MBL fold metallo-hydrolase [Legionellales bacterium]